jgi:hypothetical protein
MLADVLLTAPSYMSDDLRARLAVLTGRARGFERAAERGRNPRARATATVCFGRTSAVGNAVLKGLTANLAHAQPLEDRQ